MKKIGVFLICVLALLGCSDQLIEKEFAGVEKPANKESNEYQYYLEKARWGDADCFFAFLQFPEPTYYYIYKGRWLNDEEPYHVVHRIFVGTYPPAATIRH